MLRASSPYGRQTYERQADESASELCPEKGNYRRQAMILDPDSVAALNVSPGFWKAMDALGKDTFYPDIDMPGMTGTKDWLDDKSGILLLNSTTLYFPVA